MSDVPTPPNGNPVPPVDPTTVQPIVPPRPPAAAPPHLAADVPPHFAADNYDVTEPWYRRPGVLATIFALTTLIVIGVIVFAVSGDDNDDDTVVTSEATAMQITITRTTDDGTPFATQQTATVTGPTDTPTGFIWALPPNAIAPDPATAVTDGNGDVLFRWAPLEELIDTAGWRSTLVISELLAPDVTLGASNFNCLVERRGESTAGVSMTVDISTAPIDAEREARYSFPGHEFAPGDRMSCTVANGPFIPSATTVLETTTVPESTTTVVETTTTAATTTTTVAPTTAAPTTVAPTTAAPTTVAPTTAAPTTLPPTTAMTLIDARSDLTTFRNLIDRAGLRAQLADRAAMTTILAPNNDAIALFVGTAGAPDLNDVDNAKAFVLNHVLTGEILTSSDLAARPDITLDEGPARTINAAVSPITIGDASVIDADKTADVSILHTLDRALPDPAAP